MISLILLFTAISHFFAGEVLLGFRNLFVIAALWILLFLIDYLKEKHEKKKRAPVCHVYPSPPSSPLKQEPTEENRKIFASNLTYYLHFRGKTSQDLAWYLTIPDEKVIRWLNAKELPNENEKDQISRFLNIPWKKLTEETDHSDDAIKERAFRNAAFIIYMMDKMSLEDAKATEQYIELLYNRKNGY